MEQPHNSEPTAICEVQAITSDWLLGKHPHLQQTIQRTRHQCSCRLHHAKIRSESLGISGQNLIRDGEDFWYIEPPYVIDRK